MAYVPIRYWKIITQHVITYPKHTLDLTGINTIYDGVKWQVVLLHADCNDCKPKLHTVFVLLYEDYLLEIAYWQMAYTVIEPF